MICFGSNTTREEAEGQKRLFLYELQAPSEGNAEEENSTDEDINMDAGNSMRTIYSFLI